MIRKRGKANWEHECQVCKTASTHLDQFRAIEAHQAHAKSFTHLQSVLVETFRPINDFIQGFVESLAGVNAMSKSDFVLVPTPLESEVGGIVHPKPREN